MTWGFVTCGPNEALVISGKFLFWQIRESLSDGIAVLLFLTHLNGTPRKHKVYVTRMRQRGREIRNLFIGTEALRKFSNYIAWGRVFIGDFVFGGEGVWVMVSE